MRRSLFITLLATTVLASAAAHATPATPSDSREVQLLKIEGQPITEDTLNSASLRFTTAMNSGECFRKETLSRLSDEQRTVCNIINPMQDVADNDAKSLNQIAPAAGDDGGDDAAPDNNEPEVTETEEPSQPDEVNDPAPEEPPVVEEPAPEEPPVVEEPPAEEEPVDDTPPEEPPAEEAPIDNNQPA